MGLPHVSDACADLLGYGRAARGSLRTYAPPVIPNALLPPGHDRPRLDEYQDLLPARPPSRAPRPEQVIGGTEPWASAGLLIDGELMAQGKVFQAQGCPGVEEACGEN